MMMNKKFARLSLTMLIVLAMALSFAGIALAFDSGGNPGTTGPNHIEWIGQGADGGVLNTVQCDDSNTPYLLWILTTDGGTADTATLHLSGTGSGDYPADTASGNTFHFVTPYFTPDSNLTAYADFNVDAAGNGSWNLVISHGCAGQQAQDLTVSKTATPSFTRTFNWTIDKSADKDTVYSAGGGESGAVNFTVAVTKDGGTDSEFAVSGTITVHNSNTFDVNGVDVSDSTPGGTCNVSGSPVDVPAGGDATADYTCTFASNPGSGTNTATATWDQATYGTPSGSASGTKDYTFGDPTTVNNDEIDVTDTNGQSWHFTGTDSKTYQLTYNDPAGTCTSHENTATIDGTEQSDSVTVLDCQGADLTVSKDAAPSYDRTFAWNITKDVDKTQVNGFYGGNATFNYTIKVSHDAGTDSNFAVSGTITVTNPNDWEDVTLTSLDDVIDVGGNCTVDTSAGLTVPMSGSKDYPYECSFSSNPGSGTNTATANWDADAAHTPSGIASGSAGFAFGDPTNLIDDCVSVSDSYAGSLGTVCVGDANPTTFTYSRTVPIPQFDCVSYNNTATFTTNDTGTTGSASQTVKVCGPAKTGALTMGFWQNKNGQGIITGGSSTAGVCNSGTWLRQYNPFKDLSATATCAQVATYVTNVIKAANASGASMNAMLKAQMLATALDVYFSDPALGGNKINAPAPIGGKTIDLTAICATIASNGTCSGGITENVSSAFGGATNLTVSQILAYASSQSNSGGSAWYGNVKATQELAKDTFDAINNQLAFDP